jgi:hypothetical protein
VTDEIRSLLKASRLQSEIDRWNVDIYAWW